MTLQHDSDNIQLRRKKTQQKREVNIMSEKERKILKRLSEILPNLPESKKERILGVAEGMNIMKENMENQKAG